MAKTATTASKIEALQEKAPFPVMDPAEMAKISNRSLEIASRAARAYFNGAAKLNQGMIDFVSSRFRKDMESAQEFMTSKTSEEAFHTQANFLEMAIRDYADEASRVLNVAADMARETLQPVERAAEEFLHDVDERAQESRAAE